MLTVCNTGSLATARYGTALGVIRRLHEESQLSHAYCCETRPYNQGSRLTAFELVYERIPATLIVDSAAAALMAKGEVDAVVAGADRVTANGDTANKIGTYSLAILAKVSSCANSCRLAALPCAAAAAGARARGVPKPEPEPVPVPEPQPQPEPEPEQTSRLMSDGGVWLVQHHGVKFYIAAPFSTLDVSTPSGDQIVIEERDPTEV